MRLETHRLPNPSPLATGPGAAVSVADLLDKWVQVDGTFSATVNIEGSIDGTNWIQVVAGAADGSFTEIPQALKYLRVNLGAYASGEPVVTLSGRHGRTD